MNEHEAMRLLADANPVRVEDLADLPVASPQRHPQRRLALAAAVAAAAVAASLIGFFVFGGSSPRQSLSGRLLSPLPTLEHPLRPGAKQVTLSEATQELGAQIVLPDSSFAGASDVGPIWTQHTGPITDVAVTFPGPGLIVDYERPVPYPQPAAAMYATEAKQSSDSISTVSLNGVPALATAQNSDQLHQNFGSIEFVENGTVIRVMGHYDEATLQAVAQSIVDRSASEPPTESAGLGPIDWSNPSGTRPADSIAEAARDLPFQPVVPSRLGVPSIFVGDRDLVLVYDNPAGGKYWVVERPAGVTTTDVLRKIAQECTPSSGCQGTDTMVALNGGNEGLLIEGSPTSGMIWVEGGVYFDVMGPSDTFTANQATSVANRVADAVAGQG